MRIFRLLRKQIYYCNPFYHLKADLAVNWLIFPASGSCHPCSAKIVLDNKGPFTHSIENAVIEFFVVMHEFFDDTWMTVILNTFFFEKNNAIIEKFRA